MNQIPPNSQSNPNNLIRENTSNISGVQNSKPAADQTDKFETDLNFLAKEEKPQIIKTEGNNPPEPQKGEKLLFKKDQSGEIESVNKSFNLDIDKMDTLDFYKHALSVSNFEKAIPRDYRDLYSYFELLENSNLSINQKFKIATSGVEKILKEIESGNKLAPENQLFIEASIKLISKLEIKDSADYLLNLADKLYKSEKVRNNLEVRLFEDAIFGLVNLYNASKENNNVNVLELFNNRKNDVSLINTMLQEGRKNAKDKNDNYEESRHNTLISTLSPVLVDLNPPYEELRGGNPKEKVIEYLSKRSDKIPFLEIAKQIYKDTEYSINIHPDLKNLDLSALKVNTPAFVLPEQKEAHFDLNKIYIEAVNWGKDPEAVLMGVLSNESVHLNSKINYESIEPGKLNEEIEKMKMNKSSIPSELEYQRLMEEELVSQLADDTVVHLITNSKSQMTEEDIFSENGILFKKFEDRRDEAANLAFERVYHDNLIGKIISQNKIKIKLPLDKDEQFVYERVMAHMNSQEFKKNISGRLRDLKLIK